MSKTIIGASLGNCVHVAGVAHFLALAEQEGYNTVFLGPAVSPDSIIEAVKKFAPDIVSVGYRLTPENGVALAKQLKEKAEQLPKQPTWAFGGTLPVARAVEQLGFFDKIFDSTEDLDDCIAYLRGTARGETTETYADTLVARIAQKTPYPLLRHHFGLPSYSETLEGVREIALSKTIDVISLGIDQNTQQYFFRPEKRSAELEGAGGVPVKTEGDFSLLYRNSRCGNFPLMRCYSGTDDVLEFNTMLERSINNAWCAVPLCWYNEVDGRGTRTIEQSVKQAQQLIEQCAKRGLPVELNEPHHWGLRDAHDVVSVAMAYVSAYNAKKLGVKDYIAQYMFNIPNAISFSMDLAKVLAQIELAESLADDSFRLYRQTRAGLPFLSGDLLVAKGQLAASTMLQMSVHPHIIHVVGYSEAYAAATPQVVAESAKIVRGVVRSALEDTPDMSADERVQARKRELLSEASFLLDAVRHCYADVSSDPLADPDVIADCVKRGIFDAPHILKNEKFRGNVRTRIIDGKCLAIDENNTPVNERERLSRLGVI